MNANQIRLYALFALTLATTAFVRASSGAAEKAVPLATFAKLPIKEITVFKDGHAFVAHEGELPTDAKGNVVMDYLPAPVIGTFWPYAADKNARLASVVAGQKRVTVERTALSLHELIEANVGAEAIIEETGTNRYEATIVGFPMRSAEELAATSPPNTPDRLPEKSNLVLLKTAEGVKPVSLDRIQGVTFKGAHKSTSSEEEFRNLLTLNLDWGKARPAKSARVGLFYLQKGVRWIPDYKVELDGKGNAFVKLQATLLNELADLDDVSLNLVVGVPTFAFKDTVDPIALQQNLAQLSQYFQTDTARQNSPLASNFSNGIMSQVARASEYRAEPAAVPGGSLGPDIGDASKSEDLFVYTVPHITLKRGERMVLPIAEFTLTYKDVFTLELPFAPPPELRSNLSYEQQREMARLLSAPKVMHKLRLANNSKYPLTTAPALLSREGRLLAQAMMTYTAVGASVDLPVTAAVDFQVKKSDVETKRTPDAIRQNGSSYARVDLAGKVTLTSHHAQPAELEVTRYVLGVGDTAEHEGRLEKLNIFENSDFLGADSASWWGGYNWPRWWDYFNGVSRITWKLTLEPNQTADLSYAWHYFWL